MADGGQTSFEELGCGFIRTMLTRLSEMCVKGSDSERAGNGPKEVLTTFHRSL